MKTALKPFYGVSVANKNANTVQLYQIFWIVQECIKTFPDWLPGVRTANGTALCH